MRGTALSAVCVLVVVLLTGCGDDPTVVTGGGAVSTSAGTVDVECLGRFKVRITGTAPADGYAAHLIVPGPAAQASLIFENPAANDYRVAVYCQDAQPQLHEWVIEDTTAS